jgi:LuxR family maltose regulon positive regulatory protein
VRRPHLLEVLDGGAEKALTLVSAPAGFGKTTVLSEWVDAADPGTTFAWVSLEAADGEPVRLWTHVIAALARSGAGVGTGSLAALRESPGRVVEAVLPELLDELSVGEGRLVLVLDDYHLAENATVDAQVQSFLTYRPARVQVVVSTRSDPALHVPRLRASGELVELRADSLRFRTDELPAFFTGLGVPDLTVDDLDRLEHRTGGWPAPLRLAAMLLPEKDRGSFIDSFTGESRTVLDYLTADVLDLLEPEDRAFLLQVSVLTRLNAPLCDAVVGATGSGERLAALERANLFVFIDADGSWYHQHRLFAEALRLELRRTRPDLVPVLHARAARWLAANGDLETATEHAIASRDVAYASTLISGQVPLMASTGRGTTIRRWLARMSWPAATADPQLAFVRAVVACLDDHYDDALLHLDDARRGPTGLSDATGLSLGFRVDFLDGLAAVSQVDRALASARRAVATAPSSAWEGVASAGVGQAEYLQGRSADAVSTLRLAVSKIPDTQPLLLAVAVGGLGLAEADAPDGVTRAGPMLEPMLSRLAAIGAHRGTIAAVLHLACGETHRTSGNLRAAARSFSTATGLLAASPPGTWLALAHLLRSQNEHALGNAAAAILSVAAADDVLARVADPGNLRERSGRLADLARTPARVASEFGEQLSERELAVLHLAATGLEQRQIADQLFISYNTVKSHLKTSYRKLGVSSRAQALERLQHLELVAARGPD